MPPLLDIPGIVQGVAGLGQLIGGLFKKKPKRPTYTIPESLKAATTQAAQQAGATSMPGQDVYQQQLDSNFSNNIEAARQVTDDPNKLLASVGRGLNSKNRASQNLSAASSEYRDRANQRYQSMLMRKAAAEDRQFQINKMQPYLDESAERSRMIGSGMQNAFGGLSNFAAYKYLQKNP